MATQFINKYSKWLLELASYIRAQKPLTIILGVKYKPVHDKIGLDITYSCNLRCAGCHKAIDAVSPSDEHMTVEQVNKFIEESIAQNRKWKLIRILGGEPALHPRITEIINLLIKYKKEYSPVTVLRIDTNGHGRYVNSILSALPKEIVIRNSGKTNSNPAHHEAFYNAPVDNPFYKFADFSNGCQVPLPCGITLSRWGYYFCGAAIGVERIFGFDLGKKKLPSPDDSIRDSYQAFCKYCGHFLRFSGEKNKPGRISKTWAKALEKYKDVKPNLSLY